MKEESGEPGKRGSEIKKNKIKVLQIVASERKSWEQHQFQVQQRDVLKSSSPPPFIFRVLSTKKKRKIFLATEKCACEVLCAYFVLDIELLQQPRPTEKALLKFEDHCFGECRRNGKDNTLGAVKPAGKRRRISGSPRPAILQHRSRSLSSSVRPAKQPTDHRGDQFRSW